MLSAFHSLRQSERVRFQRHAHISSKRSGATGKWPILSFLVPATTSLNSVFPYYTCLTATAPHHRTFCHENFSVTAGSQPLAGLPTGISENDQRLEVRVEKRPPWGGPAGGYRALRGGAWRSGRRSSSISVNWRLFEFRREHRTVPSASPRTRLAVARLRRCRTPSTRTDITDGSMMRGGVAGD